MEQRIIFWRLICAWLRTPGMGAALGLTVKRLVSRKAHVAAGNEVTGPGGTPKQGTIAAPWPASPFKMACWFDCPGSPEVGRKMLLFVSIGPAADSSRRSPS